MSDFWAKKLGVAPATPQPTAPAQNNQPWWAPQTVAQPQQQPATVVGQQALVPPSQANGEQHFDALLQQDGYTTTRAMSAKDSERCPDCNSTNYISPQGHPNALKQCFDCGYNARFLHTTHGVSATGQNIPVHTARGQTLSTNNFNPKGIIAHVG